MSRPPHRAYLLGRLSLHLVAEVHVLEVLDLPGQSSGQQDALGLVLGVAAVLHLQLTGRQLLLVVHVQLDGCVVVRVALRVQAPAQQCPWMC